jgi:hypothetical protein
MKTACCYILTSSSKLLDLQNPVTSKMFCFLQTYLLLNYEILWSSKSVNF